jgi:glutamyl-Q tRNA(Asp) synthetase
MSLPPAYRGRFAPSPTGPLHFGSLVAALGSWLLARHAGGTWLVRIEDLDPPREVPGAAAGQLRTLAAFGMQSDEPVIHQSRRGALYQAALDRLLLHDQAFACRCSRRDLEPVGGVHRQCVEQPSGHRAAIRLRVAPGPVCFDDAVQVRACQDVGLEVGDFVLRRADGYWAYQLAVVVDDADQRITHVARGMDLIDSTARQIVLQRSLGLHTPQYLHLPLVTDAAGNKLSKSLAALPVDGTDPLPALAAAWAFLGQASDPSLARGSAAAALARMQRVFDPRRIPRSRPAVITAQ